MSAVKEEAIALGVEVVVKVVVKVDIAIAGIRFKLVIKLIYIQNL